MEREHFKNTEVSMAVFPQITVEVAFPLNNYDIAII